MFDRRVFNFAPGPATLPEEVLKQAADEMLNWNGLGMGVMEVSHRGKPFMACYEETLSDLRELMNIPDNYAVLFLQGGASLQFDMIPMNWLGEGETAAYTNTGVWAGRAIKEAKLFGNVNVVASSEDKNFSYLPKGYTIPADAKYFHCTSNNTIYGTEMFDFPTPMVCR